MKDREINSWMIEFPGRNFQRERAAGERETGTRKNKYILITEQLRKKSEDPTGKLHIVGLLENYSYLIVVYFLPVLFDYSGELQHR